MNVVPIPTTLISGPYRFRGWRGTIRQGGLTVWRCVCDRPHRTKDAADACSISELRARLGRQGMRIWTATYRPKQQFTLAEIEYMDEERAMALLEIQTNPHLPSSDLLDNIPTTAEGAKAALIVYEKAILHDAHWNEVRRNMRVVDIIRTAYKDNKSVRQQADTTLRCGDWRFANEFIAAQEAGLVAVEGRPQNLSGSEGLILPPTVAELFTEPGRQGYAYVHRLRQIHPLSLDDLKQRCTDLHLSGKDATLNAVVEAIRTDETRERRRASLHAEPLPDGMKYRKGDCRVMFDDIESNSIAAIITDPPYGREANPLYNWLGEFSNRVLMPGGSLICYTGQGLLPDRYQALGRHLTYWWTAAMLHAHAQKMLHAGVTANHKPILWYVKGNNRRIVHGRKTLVLDVLNDRAADTDEGRALSQRDKSDHLWAQGDAGVRVWFHHLAAVGETIIDPFAGTGNWGRIAASMGRQWIGCDIEEGGVEDVMTDDLDEAAD